MIIRSYGTFTTSQPFYLWHMPNLTYTPNFTYTKGCPCSSILDDTILKKNTIFYFCISASFSHVESPTTSRI